jgi:hypothetical protein
VVEELYSFQLMGLHFVRQLLVYDYRTSTSTGIGVVVKDNTMLSHEQFRRLRLRHLYFALLGQGWLQLMMILLQLCINYPAGPTPTWQ